MPGVYTRIRSHTHCQTTQIVREHTLRFSEEFVTELPKVSRRFVFEMVFRIQNQGSVRLLDLGRELGEKISIKMTKEWFCRQLGRRRSHREIRRRLVEHVALRVEEDQLLVLDLSDATKKCAEWMENIDRARDGSEKNGWPDASGLKAYLRHPRLLA